MSAKIDHAVILQKACKRYGTKNDPNVVLDRLNMTVPQGTIYSLLGASGCGKTTLLSCIVGMKRLDSGEIRVLGGTPGSRGSGVPGPRVGYMPQDIALYGGFTIRETLKYFGWISDVTMEEVESRLAFFVELLMLPHSDQMVKDLSGGERRRVSLAAALIHRPELVILDEPTVGVDPLLRHTIWNHLIEITRNCGTTVLLTTHYIDEARQADLVAMMRGGHLLAEHSPEHLLSQFNDASLENVFLKLSLVQNMRNRRRSSILRRITEDISIPTGIFNEAVFVDDEVTEITGDFDEGIPMSNCGVALSDHALTISSEVTTKFLPIADLPPEDLPPLKFVDQVKFVDSNHMQALIWKNLLWMWRNIPFMVFVVGLPVAVIVLFCISFGHDPKNLDLAIVNHELGSANDPCNFTQECNSTRLSCYYLHFVQDLSFNLHYFDDEEIAKNYVRRGKAWAALVMAHNFSDAFRSRLVSPTTLKSWDFEHSTVDIYQDNSDVTIGLFVRRHLLSSFESFINDLLVSCDKDPGSYKLPIRWEHPVYGDRRPDFTNFAAPGILLIVIFFIAMILTALTMIMERREGILERSLVNGITEVELLFAHFTTQFLIMLSQNLLVITFCFFVLGVEMNGSYFLLVSLTVITGVCGMFFGFTVSCSCDSEGTAIFVALGAYFPSVLLCGIIWPLEGMHKWLKKIIFFIPMTKTTESLRCIMARGWGLEKSEVYGGFIAIVIWIFVFLAACIILLKFKKS